MKNMILKIKHKKLSVIIISCCLFSYTNAQTKREERIKNRAKEVGEFQLGMRSTVSMFDHNGFWGLGYGGMFRVRPGKRINTEWYCDYIKTDIAGLGYNKTIHIGWSVMIYPFKTETIKGKFTPYLIGGNCFDYAKVSSVLYYDPIEQATKKESSSRLTTAVQAGLGVNYHFTNRFNLSLSAQYMEHIGRQIHTHIVDKDGMEVEERSRFKDEGNRLSVEIERETVLSGHMLITLSLNITLFDMAK